VAQGLATQGARQGFLGKVMQPSCEIIAARWYCHMPGSSVIASAAPLGVTLDQRRAPLRHRIDDAQHVEQHFDGGVQRVLEQMFLGVDQPVLLDAILDHTEQGFRVAGLEQKRNTRPSFTAAIVDSRSAWPESTMRTVCGAISFTLARNRAPSISGIRMSEHDRERALRLDEAEARGSAGRGFDFDAIAQLATDAVEHIGSSSTKQHAVHPRRASFGQHAGAQLRAIHSSGRHDRSSPGNQNSGADPDGRGSVMSRMIRDAVGDVHDARQAEGSERIAGSS